MYSTRGSDRNKSQGHVLTDNFRCKIIPDLKVDTHNNIVRINFTLLSSPIKQFKDSKIQRFKAIYRIQFVLVQPEVTLNCDIINGVDFCFCMIITQWWLCTDEL
jgi:hypothetical protein